MAKRSERDFDRRPNDSYDTESPRAVWPLLHHVAPGSKYAELCAGKGELIKHLAVDDIHCVYAIDIKPRAKGIGRGDAMKVTRKDLPKATQFIITNPPWTRELLHPMIAHWLTLGLPIWLLFDADWMHNTEDTGHLIRHCRKIVSVGRVKWFKETTSSGKDNCCWYLFDPIFKGHPTFHTRRGG